MAHRARPSGPQDLVMTFTSWSATMQTPKEYRHNAEVCLKLAYETKELYARMALIDLATEFRALAEALERLPRVAQH
jgi:hypothetical protein